LAVLAVRALLAISDRRQERSNLIGPAVEILLGVNVIL
jgi:hypothetical protein